ncbi:MAG: hypothetical protein QOJ02_50 [Acidobacteriota bacterium]|jgi:hypothetical protein|nr:hypothetical protein [Acidobacteriota bacterium]
MIFVRGFFIYWPSTGSYGRRTGRSHRTFNPQVDDATGERASAALRVNGRDAQHQSHARLRARRPEETQGRG